MKVKNMENSKGNKVANQFVITDGPNTYFQSYDSIIVRKHCGIIELDEHYWDYSITTGKLETCF